MPVRKETPKVLPDKERLLIVASNLEGYFADLLNDTGLIDGDAEVREDAATLREIAERL